MQKISEVRGQMEDHELHRISKEGVEMSRKEGQGQVQRRHSGYIRQRMLTMEM